MVLSLLRTALGTATAPPNAVIIALALFLTAFVMGPALQNAYDVGIKPLVNNEISTFFVLVDGWSLVAGSLIQSYGT